MTLLMQNISADVLYFAQASQGGAVGPEFGKSSPIGLLVLVLLLIVVLMEGWFFHRRYSLFGRRTLFPGAAGLDPSDQETLDQAMKDAGVFDYRRKSKF